MEDPLFKPIASSVKPRESGLDLFGPLLDSKSTSESGQRDRTFTHNDSLNKNAMSAK